MPLLEQSAMKTKALGSFFVLFAIVAGLAAFAPSAYADHATATVSVPEGTAVPGCEETDECYIPATVTIDVGGEITWTNDDTAAHTVTSGTAEDGPDGFFDSSLFMAGTTYEFKFDGFDPGEYPYFCMVHPWMVGTVVVQEAGAEEEEEVHEEDEVHMEGDATATGMLSDGTMVSIWTSEPMAGERMEISMKIDGEHVNHDILVTQNGNVVLDDKGAHHHEGTGVHETAPLDSSDPVDVTITFQGYGISEPFTGPAGEEVVFTNVVPEFGTIAVMILVIAISSVIILSRKYNMNIRV